jgi:quercetin dioxygenase-like cupin family protein
MPDSTSPRLYGRVVHWDDLPMEEVRPGLLRCAYTTDEVMLVLNRARLGVTPNPHRHADFDQLVHILDGEAEYCIEDSVNRMERGSMLLIPAGSTHHLRPVSDEVTALEIFAPPRTDLAHLAAWLDRSPLP